MTTTTETTAPTTTATSTTAKYQLPLISGNMTADVVRDLNALATKTDEVIATLASASANKGKLEALTTEFEAHKAGFTTEEGVHNMRYFNNKFEVKVGEEWKPAAVLLDSTPPGNATAIKAAPGNQTITLTWENPTDSDFEKVVIRIKKDSAVTGAADGELFYEGKEKTAQKASLTNDSTYHIRFFVYDIAGNVNSNTAMQVTAMPTNVKGVTDFAVKQDAKGELFTLTWVNPSDDTYVKTIVYASETDLTAKTREQCVSGESGTITEIYSGTALTDTHVTQPGKTYYFKAFAEHTGTKYDGGVVTSLLAEDTQPPGPIGNFKAFPGEDYVELEWTNPVDTDFEEVIIRYKTDAYPTGENDGQLAYQGPAESHTVLSLQKETEYFFRAFTVDTNGNVNKTEVQLTALTVPTYIYGVKINTADSNPETALEYTDDASTASRPSMSNRTYVPNGWDTRYPFNEIKPCVLTAEGKVNYYLDPDDFSKKADGGAAVLDGSDGNVMIEFPKIYWNFERAGQYLHVRYSNSKVNEGYKCYAHMRGDEEKEKVYIGAYLGAILEDKLQSISAKAPSVGRRIAEYRTLAQENGQGYELVGFYQILMLQVLYTVSFSNLNSQGNLGFGFAQGNGGLTQTGGLNARGMYTGFSSTTEQVKYAGIEDIYGNALYLVDGIKTGAQNTIFVGMENFNDGATGYTEHPITTVVSSGFFADVEGTTELGFTPKHVNGASASSSTYYCDAANIHAHSGAYFGGHFSSGMNAGMYGLHFSVTEDFTSPLLGARLMYL